MLKHAFKEWAVICKALAEGQQRLILRKGGIEESGGRFTVEQTRFWLYPTYVHQQRDGIKADAIPLLEQAEAQRPPEGVVRLSHLAEVAGIYHVHNLAGALMLEGLHLWSQKTVEARFNYRYPGVFVLPVRIFRAAEVFELPETPQYAGCRSWVELDRELSTEGAVKVWDEDRFRDLLRKLDYLLNPTAFV